MLDDTPVHVQNINQPIGSNPETHRPKSRIGRYQKFFVFVILFDRYSDTIGSQDIALNKIYLRTAGKTLTIKISMISMPCIIYRSRCGGEMTKLLRNRIQNAIYITPIHRCKLKGIHRLVIHHIDTYAWWIDQVRVLIQDSGYKII